MKRKTENVEVEASNTKQGKTRNVPQHVLNAFDNLVPDDAPGQAKASVVILKHVDQLISSQSSPNLPEDVVYIVKRLISGLVSNRQRVREGFCSTLQALLQLQPTIVTLTYQALLELCEDKKNLTKEETRNFLIGELLGYGALIRSGHVKNNVKMRGQVLERLFFIRDKKQYYDIIISHFLVHMMEKFTKSVVYQEIIMKLNKELSVPLEDLTPCKLWLRLVILRKFPEIAPEAFSETLLPKNYGTICNIIVKTSINMPNVHPCLGETISSLASHKKRDGTSPVVQFWVKGLTPYLKEPTTNCLQLLFNALQLILLNLKTAKEIIEVCNSDVITHLLNVMSLHDKNLNASARGVGSALLQLATTNYEQDNKVQLAIAKVIIEKPGSVRFDQLTGTKLLCQMRMHFTTATVISVSKLVRKIMDNTDSTVRTSDKIGCAFFLGKLVSLPRMNVPEHDNWKKEQLLLLMTLALFKPDAKQTMEEYQDIFFRCLGSQMSRIKEYRVMLQYLLEEADKSIQAAKDSAKPHLSPRIKVTWDKTIKKLAEMQESKTLPPVAIDVFQVLYIQMAIYMFADEQVKEIIDEVDGCYKEVRKEKRKAVCNSDGEIIYEPTWVDMVVELLLSLLPHENSLFRSLVQGVFWLLCPMMTPLTLNSIVDVLDPAKKDSLINIEEEEDEEEEDEEDEENTEEDENEDSNDEEDMEVDEEESEEESESEPEDDNEKLAELKKQMLALSGDFENDVDMDSIPQEELDNVNEKLGSLVGAYLKLKQKKSLKHKGVEKLRSDEVSLMHYRSRVCDLLELYLKESPDMGLILSLINPLITVLLNIDQDRNRQGELLSRIRKLLVNLGRIKKFKDNGEATIESVVEDFNTFFSTSVKIRYEFNPIIHGCYSLFINCGLQLLGENAHDSQNMLMQSYLSHLREIFTQNKYNLRIQMFTDVCLRDCGGLWAVTELMKGFAFNGKVKWYWRTQAMQILNKLFQNEALLSRVDKETVIKMESDLCTQIIQVISPTTPLSSIRGQYLSEIFGLLNVLRKNETVKKLPCGINWEEVGSALVSLRQYLSSKTYRICRGPFNGIINNLGLSKLVVKVNIERPVGEASGEVTGEASNDVNPAAASDKKVSKKNKRKQEDGEENVAVPRKKQKQRDKKVLKNSNVKPKKKGTNKQSQKKKKKLSIDSR